MQTSVASRHFEVTPAILSYIEERFVALDHLSNNALRGQVVLDHDSHHGGQEYLLKAHLRGAGEEVNVEVRSADLYDGIDLLTEKLDLRLRRMHDRTLQFLEVTDTEDGESLAM